MKRLAIAFAIALAIMLIATGKAQSETKTEAQIIKTNEFGQIGRIYAAEKPHKVPQIVNNPRIVFDYKKPPEPPKIEPVAVIQPVQPAPKPQPATQYSGSLAKWLRVLRMCESGGNYQINTGNGYYGAYQFSAATWNHWNTGYARADLAPPAVQDATIIKNTNAASGGLATQNPGCYQKHGLSAFPPAG